MDTLSGAALARELGTSVPRIGRAIDRLGLDARQPSGRFALTPPQADEVRRSLGSTPLVTGLGRPEVRVLAALRSAPFGLVSARAVARRSGLSPTSAACALRSLLAKELVTLEEEVIAAGRARTARVWRVNPLHTRWAELDPLLAKVKQPEKQPAQPDRRVPSYLRHLFWNTAESQLDVATAGPYIARRLLRTMDLQGLAWGAQTLSPDDWRTGSRARGLEPSVRQLARNLAGTKK